MQHVEMERYLFFDHDIRAQVPILLCLVASNHMNMRLEFASKANTCIHLRMERHAVSSYGVCLVKL